MALSNSSARDFGAVFLLILSLFVCESILLVVFDLLGHLYMVAAHLPIAPLDGVGIVKFFASIAVLRAFAHIPGVGLGFYLAFWVLRIRPRIVTASLLNLTLFWLVTTIYAVYILRLPGFFLTVQPIASDPRLLASIASLLSPALLWRWVHPLFPRSES